MNEIKVTNHKPPYSYLKPVIDGVSYNKYEGLSIKEIEEKYGKGEAQWVYFMATKGVDLTKSRFKKIESEPYVQVELHKNGGHYLCQLCVSEEENITLFDVVIDHRVIQEESSRYILNNLFYESMRKMGLL